MGFNCCYLGYEIGMQFVFKYADWKKCSIKTKVDMFKVKENQPQTCAAGFSNGNRHFGSVAISFHWHALRDPVSFPLICSHSLSTLVCLTYN